MEEAFEDVLNFIVPLGEIFFAFEDQDGAYREEVLEKTIILV